MLKRKLYSALMEWKKEHSHQKALLILGAPQTGKTTLVRSCKFRGADCTIPVA